MSAFSDWKCGAITDEEFYSLTARENRRDKALEEMMYEREDENEDETQRE